MQFSRLDTDVQPMISPMIWLSACSVKDLAYRFFTPLFSIRYVIIVLSWFICVKTWILYLTHCNTDSWLHKKEGGEKEERKEGEGGEEEVVLLLTESASKSNRVRVSETHVHRMHAHLYVCKYRWLDCIWGVKLFNRWIVIPNDIG